MAGVKGRSGRRPEGIAQQRKRVIDKAWQIISDALHDTTIDKLKRISIAESIVGRELAKHSTMDHTFTLSLEAKAALIKRVTSRQRDDEHVVSGNVATARLPAPQGVIDEKI